MSKTLGVGIIGASAQRGWAKDSHVPAVQGLAGLELVAVAAGDEQKAQAAAQAFGAKSGYASGFDLIKDPAVDIVTIAVKGFQAGGEEQGMIFGTVSQKEAAKLESIAQGTFADWRWLGFAERRIVELVDWREGKELTAFRYCAMEVRSSGDQEALLIPPFTSGDLSLWKAVVKMEPGALLFAKSQPLLGIDRNLRLAADSKQGLGLPPFILTPNPTILAALTLRPGERFCYRDPSGPGLALVTWRADYDRNEYQLTHPRISGSGIAIRPDLFDRLTEMVGRERLLLRDFILGDSTLASQESRG